MRFLFAIALLGVVLAVAGCTPATKAVDSKPPDTKPGVGTISDGGAIKPK